MARRLLKPVRNDHAIFLQDVFQRSQPREAAAGIGQMRQRRPIVHLPSFHAIAPELLRRRTQVTWHFHRFVLFSLFQNSPLAIKMGLTFPPLFRPFLPVFAPNTSCHRVIANRKSLKISMQHVKSWSLRSEIFSY